MSLTHAELVQRNKQYTLSSWSAQSAWNPISMVRGEGAYFWDADGKRYLDWSSQLINVNVGHGHPHVIKAIQGTGDRTPPIRCDRHRGHLVQMSLEDPQLQGGLEVPQPQRVISGSRKSVLPLGRDRQRTHRRRVTGEGFQGVSRSQIPDSDGRVGRSGEQPAAVRRDSQREHVPLVSLDPLDEIP